MQVTTRAEALPTCALGGSAEHDGALIAQRTVLILVVSALHQ
jgi:hypothetical protein